MSFTNAAIIDLRCEVVQKRMYVCMYVDAQIFPIIAFCSGAAEMCITTRQIR